MELIGLVVDGVEFAFGEEKLSGAEDTSVFRPPPGRRIFQSI